MKVNEEWFVKERHERAKDAEYYPRALHICRIEFLSERVVGLRYWTDVNDGFGRVHGWQELQYYELSDIQFIEPAPPRDQVPNDAALPGEENDD